MLNAVHNHTFESSWERKKKNIHFYSLSMHCIRGGDGRCKGVPMQMCQLRKAVIILLIINNVNDKNTELIY